MDIIVGETYRCTFKHGFESIGYDSTATNPMETGLYRLVRIMSYDELLETSLSLLEDTYKAVGKSTDGVKADLNTLYLNKRFFIFEEVLDSTIRRCLCEEDLDGDPIFGISAYGKYAVVLDMGAWSNPAGMDATINYLKDEITHRFGVAFDPAGLQIQRYRMTYLTDNEYAAVVATREQTKSSTINYAAQLASVQALLNQKVAECKALQATLQALTAPQ